MSNDLDKEIEALQAQHSAPALGELEFQDATPSGRGGDGLRGQIGAPDTAALESAGLVAPAGSGAANSGSSGGSRVIPFLSLERFKPYFDVSTVLIQDRLRKAVFPFKGEKLLMQRLAKGGDVEDFDGGLDREGGQIMLEEPAEPDLYGGFWISTSLVFLMAVCGNMASFLSFSPQSAGETWHVNFEKVTWAAMVIYGYVAMAPFAVFCFLRYQGVQRLTADKLLCIYGYSLAVFIPASILCVLPSEFIRWLLIMAAFGTSAFFLYVNLFKDMLASSDMEQRTKVLAGVAIVMHLMLAMAFKFYFFEYKMVTSIPMGPAPASSLPAAVGGNGTAMLPNATANRRRL